MLQSAFTVGLYDYCWLVRLLRLVFSRPLLFYTLLSFTRFCLLHAFVDVFWWANFLNKAISGIDTHILYASADCYISSVLMPLVGVSNPSSRRCTRTCYLILLHIASSYCCMYVLMLLYVFPQASTPRSRCTRTRRARQPTLRSAGPLPLARPSFSRY